MNQSKLAGNTLTEYGITLSLITLIAMGGLTLFGESSKNLFHQMRQTLQGKSLQPASQVGVAATTLNTQGALSNSGTGMQDINTATSALGGSEALLNANATTGGGTNATSTEGAFQIHSMQSLSYAQKMQQLAESISDEKSRKWVESVAEQMYYLGGAEGVFSGVGALAPQIKDDKIYTKSSALNDILTMMQKDLPQKLGDAPKEADPKLIAKVTQLGQKVLGVANNFMTQYDQSVASGEFAKAENQSFLMTDANGQSGKFSDKSYSSLVDLDTLKQSTQQVLASQPDLAKPVRSTLEHAIRTDAMAPGAQASRSQ